MPVDDFVPRPMPEPERRAAASPRPQAPNRPSKNVYRARRAVVGGIAVVILLVVGVVAYGAWRWSSVARTEVDLAEPLDGSAENWLVVGSDSRDSIAAGDPDASAFIGGNEATGGRRSDTLVLVRIDPGSEQVHLMSLPRDLWVPIARTDERERINTAYSYEDGPQRLIDTIEEDFDLDIHHYVEVDFAGFEAIVDAVDGVPMDFEVPVRDANSGLVVDQAGCRTLTGDEALAFARSRHLEYRDGSTWQEEPSGDLGRIARQQQFMLAVFDRAASRVRGADLGAANGLIGAVVDHVTLDTQLDMGRAVQVARRFADLGTGAITTHALPVVPYTTPGGASVLRLDHDQAQPVINIFRGLPADDLPAHQVMLRVLYDPTEQAMAATVSDALEGKGFVVTETGTLGSSARNTAVRYAPGNERIATEIARHIDPVPQLVEDPSYKDGRTVLVVGQDIVGVRSEPRPLDQITRGTTPGSSTSTTVAPTTTVVAHPNCDS